MTALPSAYGEESPDVLRRRADILLDEMMLGGVDTASAGPHTEPYSTNGTSNGTNHWSQDGEFGLEYDGRGYGSNGAAGNSHAANGYHEPATPETPTPPTAKQTYSPPVDSAPLSPSGPRLISAEERYAQLTGARPAAQPNVTATPPRPAAQPGETPLERATASSSMPTNGEPAPPTVTQTTSNSAVRRQSPSMASTMSVNIRGANRSNLLPRNNEIDAVAAQQEINDLLRALNTALPAGNEAVERSRHLLNKAQTLLQSDPTRTAEVEYYLQQVRRIVQRARQTQQWSSLYRRRLTTYLGAWLLLSLLAAGAATLYALPLADWLNQTVALPDWWMVMHQAPLLVAAAFAGSLGASLSALLHMQRHAAREYGYFDRKYGLRGLLLPLLGLFWGLLLAVTLAGVYLAVGLDPVLYTWAIAVPAAVALLIGFGQPWLYGAR